MQTHLISLLATTMVIWYVMSENFQAVGNYIFCGTFNNLNVLS